MKMNNGYIIALVLVLLKIFIYLKYTLLLYPISILIKKISKLLNYLNENNLKK